MTIERGSGAPQLNRYPPPKLVPVLCDNQEQKHNAHSAQHDAECAILFICADYCLLGDEEEQDNVSILVGGLFSNSSLLAVPCDRKGHDEYDVHRTEAFLKSEGVFKLANKSDQEHCGYCSVT